MALQHPQSLDANRYASFSGLASHCDQSGARVNVAPENADALAKPDRGVEHQREHRLCAPDSGGLGLAADYRYRLPLVKHWLPGLLLWDERNAESVNVPPIRKPVAEDLPRADVVVRSPYTQARFSHRYDGVSDLFQGRRQALSLERSPAFVVETNRGRFRTVQHFAFADAI